jgi:acyl carrier protein
MSQQHDIDTRLERIFKDIFPDEQMPLRQLTPMNTTAWDSLAHMNLLLSIEQEFGVSLTDDEAVDLNSFDVAADVVAGKLA